MYIFQIKFGYKFKSSLINIYKKTIQKKLFMPIKFNLSSLLNTVGTRKKKCHVTASHFFAASRHPKTSPLPLLITCHVTI